MQITEILFTSQHNEKRYNMENFQTQFNKNLSDHDWELLDIYNKKAKTIKVKKKPCEEILSKTFSNGFFSPTAKNL